MVKLLSVPTQDIYPKKFPWVPLNPAAPDSDSY